MKNLSDINIEKSRSGVYKDNSENRRLHRVGQRYGSPAREEDSASKPLTRSNTESKKPTSIRVKGGTFKVDDNGRILASAHGPQENISKLLKFASENGYKLDWKEVNEEPERGVDKYARGGYLGIGFGGKTDWDDRQHRLTKILVGLAEQNSDLKNRLVDEVLKIRRDVDGWHFKNEKEARDLALFNFRNWVNRLETEDKLKYIKEASGVNNGLNSEEAKNTNKEMNEAIKQGGESFTRVNLPDIPNAHKVNLTKYLSAKRKKAVDDAWDKAKFDSLPREKAGVFQEGYNKLREQFNNNFDDMSKSERAELLYKILKMKNAMERK